MGVSVAQDIGLEEKRSGIDRRSEKDRRSYLNEKRKMNEKNIPDNISVIFGISC